MTQQMRVSTGSYRASHGKNPRGYGHWMFHMDTNRCKEMFFYTGMYSEAKKAAVKFAQEKDARNVTVMS